MKRSKILKTISYLVLLMLISILILSIFTISARENPYYNEEEYFDSYLFVGNYMTYLDNAIDELIYDNDSLYSVQDGEIELHYSINQGNYYSDFKERYFLIIYKNKALTNIELTNNTNTVESIKEYIKNKENTKKVNIINGNIESESTIIQNTGVQYLNSFETKYYTYFNDEENGYSGRQYITATAEDFQIYSSYVEEFREDTEVGTINNILKKLKSFETSSYYTIPINSILIILILVYLIVSIGYKKGAEGIILNDFDKVPLEIILFVAIALGCTPLFILEGINNNYHAIISLIITAYLSIYVLFAVTFNTVVKRIKSKTFLKSSIIGKIILWIANVLEIILNKSKEVGNTVTYSTNITLKVLLYFGIVIPIGIFIVFAFRKPQTVFFLELALAVIVAYRVIKISKDFSKIENKLKEMYDGNNQNILNKKDFGKEFHSSVKYINDISNGFDNAIQDRMKSERLKAELITNVSHDIKTPLTSIINYVDLLKQENIENQKVKEYIEILDNKSQRLKKLTEDLVEASKVSTGNISLNLEDINIVQLIKQALGEFEDKFKKRGLETILDCNDNEIIIKADNKYMYRIIENLFSNISKYALENSRVYVDIKKTQKGVIIAMKNISKDRLNITADELMQRFVRADKSRTTEGSGLGISIAQNLTELQDGQFKLMLDGDLFKVELEWEF